MDLGLKDRVVFVGGSSRGIGRAIAEAFLGEGARVAISGRDADALGAARRELERTGSAERVLAWQGDLTETGSPSAAVAAVTQRWGAPDVLVANVGSGSGPSGWDAPDEQWERAFRVNFFGSVALCRAALPAMISKGRGVIALVGSIAGLESLTAPLSYGAAKAALVHYAKGLSRLVGRSGVRVNVVAPGNILFPGGSWERRVAEKGDEVRRYIEAEVPLARFGEPREIADAVVFLCSERAAFVTGSVLVADGGQIRSL